MPPEAYIAIGLGLLGGGFAAAAAIMKMVNPSARYVRMETCDAMHRPISDRLLELEHKVDSNAERTYVKLEEMSKSLAEVRAIVRTMANGTALVERD